MNYSFDKYKDKYGGYTDEEGTSWEGPVDMIMLKRLDCCGCGMPEENLKFLLEVLEELNSHDYRSRNEKLKAIFQKNISNVIELFLHWLDSKKITEHGGSVYGSWINDEEFLKDCRQAVKELEF